MNGDAAYDRAGPSDVAAQRSEVDGHALDGIMEDNGAVETPSQTAYDQIASCASLLDTDHLNEVCAELIARRCMRQQEEHLAAFAKDFPAAIDADFKATHPEVVQSFLTMLSGMNIKISEQALDSTSSQQGTITIGLPGLPDGVNVTKSVEHFFVDDSRILLERNEVRVKMGGLDVYSGYWLAVDAPSQSIEDPLQEEGIDTLRRVMEAAGIPLTDEVFEDPLEYPFLSALLAPFGPAASLPFEPHLRALHAECSNRHGGCWYRMSSARKARSTLEQVTEVEDDEVEEDVESAGGARRLLTDAEEADLEISKLDL